MSHFYGIMQGSRGKATRCGTKKSGMTVTAASWAGAITVSLSVDENGNDCFSVDMHPWHGAGDSACLARGIVGRKPNVGAANT